MILISASVAGKDNPGFVHDDAKPGRRSGKPEPGKSEPKQQVGAPGPVDVRQGGKDGGQGGKNSKQGGKDSGQSGKNSKQGGKEASKKGPEEDHEFDIEGKSAVSGKKRTGWM